MRDQIKPYLNTIEYVTVVTHGFQIADGDGDSLRGLSTDIIDATDLVNDLEKKSRSAWLLDYDVNENGVSEFDDNESMTPTDNGPPNHVVLQFDWAPESDEPSAGWGEAAGDALFSTLVGLGLVDIVAGVNNPQLHFIGHSFGTAVTSEAVERLARYNVPVAQLTYLDPHDFAQTLLPVDGSQQLWTLGKPYSTNDDEGYGASVWSNVAFADVYYQTEYLPAGRPIPGAYNRNVDDQISGVNQHTQVWDTFYRGSIKDLTSIDGYGLSPMIQNFLGKFEQPPATFFGEAQGHQYSSTLLIADRSTGTPNTQSLAMMGETPESITNKRWAPDAPQLVYNGDFEFAGNFTMIPGWTSHGGDGGGFVPLPQNGNRFLRLNGQFNSDGAKRTHNRIYIPSDARFIRFDFRDVRSSGVDSDDQLVIKIGNTTIGTVPLQSVTSDWTREYPVAIPDNYKNSVDTITFEVRPGGPNGAFQSIVDIDNIVLQIGSPFADVESIIAAFNTGVQAVRQSGLITDAADVAPKMKMPIAKASRSSVQGGLKTAQVSNIIETAFGVDLPIIDQSPAEISKAGVRFATPFLNDLSPASKLDDLTRQLNDLGFDVTYLDTTPNANGDYLRAKFQKTWSAETSPLSFGISTGFDYFDSGVSGDFGGTLSASIQPVTLDVVLGVDLSDGAPTFYFGEESSLTIGGITISGNIATNMAIRNLLDVDINGPVVGSIAGALTFADSDNDDKLRTSQLADPASIVRGSLNGSLSFNPSLTATLPIIGDITWGGSWEATILDGNLEVGAPTLNPPSTASIEQLLRTGYKTVAGAFELFGGTNLNTNLPVVETGLGKVLGLPDFLTDGSLGEAGFEIRVTPQSVLDLINGKVVDLIHFESQGGDSFSKNLSVPLVAGVIPLGPVPLSVSLAFITEIQAGWNYYVGLGIDTVGFYIDPGTTVSASGSILAGLQAEVSLLGLAGIEITAGVGGSVSLSVGFDDPDPRDGRIYLDELLNQGDMSVGDALLNSMNVSLAGEAFGFARGVVEFLFWDWEVFNERFTIASFNTQLSGSNQKATTNPTSQRNITGRAPLGNGVLDDNLLQNGTLTINTQTAEHAGRPNTVSLTDAGSGQIEVTWRGVGRRVYQPGQIQNVVYIGNERADRFYVGENVTVPVRADGFGGNDLIRVEDAPATIDGGTGNDILRGGRAMDSIFGGDGDDRIEGGGGDDLLHGGDGNDRIEGDGGDDQIFGDSGLDVLIGGTENDVIDGGADNDVLYGGLGDDTIDGGDGENILYGQQGNDTLQGGDDDDVLIGGANNDTLRGGAGNDTLFGDRGYADTVSGRPDGDDKLFGQAGDDRLFGEGGDDLLVGDDDGQIGDDLLVGDAGKDILRGSGGNDQLLGGSGEDQLHGGDGDDVLNGNQDSDVLWGDAGEDTLQIDFASAGAQVVDELHGGLGRDQLAIVGSVRQEVVDGTPVINSRIDDFIQLEQLSGDNFRAINRDPVSETILDTFLFTLDTSLEGDIEELGMQGLGGNDRLEVLTGPLAGKNLVLDGGEGNDTLVGGQGRDILKGGPGDDKLFGGDNEDALYGGQGRDQLDGGAGVDFIDAGPGGDIVSGGVGREVIRGGPGDDILMAGSGFYGSIISGGDGNDTIIGSAGIDWLDGEGGDDLILGGDLGDRISGGAGNDTLVGEFGRDNIAGNDGDDILYTHLNNQLRAELGLGPFAELLPGERQSRFQQLLADLPQIQVEQQALLAIPGSQRTDEQTTRLRVVEDAITINLSLQIDLLQYQTIYVDSAQGGLGKDTIYGSPNFDILLGGADDDDIHSSGGYRNATNQGDIIKGEGGNDTLWFDGTEGDDQITIFSQLDVSTGNRQVSVDLDGDGIADRFVQELTIENIGVRALSGNDNVSVDFGNLALAGVEIDAGPGDDYVDASTLQSKATLIGGAGDDTLIGGLNSDFLRGDSGDDDLRGGPGSDTIQGGSGNDRIDGGNGSDWLYGGLGHDVIEGGPDNAADNLIGSAGRDTLSGGGGNDYIVGGPGEDVIYPSSGTDTIVNAVPPTVAESTQTNTRFSRTVSFSEPLKEPCIYRVPNYVIYSNSRVEDLGQRCSRVPVDVRVYRYVTAVRNWGLTRDGIDVAKQISDITQSIDPGTGLANVLLTFSPPLVPGEYVLTATGYITDVDGNAIDGNGDGAAGDDYVERFTIAAPPLPLGGALQTSSGVAEDHQGTAVAVNPADRSYVVTWYGPGSEANETDIYAQRFDVQGESFGDKFRVNTYTQDNQTAPSISMDADGGFVIVWDTVGPFTAGHVTWGRRFDADGTPVDQQFPINIQSSASSTQPSVAVDADGDFVVVWRSNTAAISGAEIYAQRFTSDGFLAGTAIRVSDGSSASSKSTPKIDIDAAGNFVVTWFVGGSDQKISARWFTMDGAGSNTMNLPYAPAIVGGSQRIAMNAKGESVIVWSVDIDGKSDVNAQRYDSQRRRVADSFVVNTTTSGNQIPQEVLMDDDGNILFVWSDDGSIGGGGYSARWFDASGNLLADEFRIADVGDVSSGVATAGISPDGEIVIVWSAEDENGSTLSAQRYTMLPPELTNIETNSTNNGFVVGFSQPMATSGAGSVLQATNWALKLADDTFLVQDDASGNPLATAEQFGEITHGYNPTSGRWEVTIALNFTMSAGNFELIARSSLRDSSGRSLVGGKDVQETLVGTADFGNAPSPYPTTLADDGAHHIPLGPRLGARRDAEQDAMFALRADEDGVQFGTIQMGGTIAAANIMLQNAESARIDAWIDFDRDGVWESSERILNSVKIFDEMQTLNFSLPPGITAGDTYARVRISSAGNLDPTGPAIDGEVEDYLITVVEPAIVESVVINHGDSQRSSIDRVTVTFDRVLDVNTTGGDPFKFINTDTGETAVDVAVVSKLDNKTVVDFRFTPGPTVTASRSLADGNYQFVVDASLVSYLGVELDGDSDGKSGGDHVFGTDAVDTFYRKYGDVNANGVIDLIDFAEFRRSFGTSSGDNGYQGELDSDGDEKIGLTDFAEFRRSFGT